VGATGSLPSGAVSVTQTPYKGGANGVITVLGGSSVNVTSSGGAGSGAIVVGTTSPSSNNSKGAISVTDNNSSDNSADTIAVYGGIDCQHYDQSYIRRYHSGYINRCSMIPQEMLPVVNSQ
jgi:hypothetical protein